MLHYESGKGKNIIVYSLELQAGQKDFATLEPEITTSVTQINVLQSGTLLNHEPLYDLKSSV